MSSTIDPNKLKVTELREQLQARGLDTKGNKPALVKRLKKALEEELNRELPDTSIADTSTEDVDNSQIQEEAETVGDIEKPDVKQSVDSQTSALDEKMEDEEEPAPETKAVETVEAASDSTTEAAENSKSNGDEEETKNRKSRWSASEAKEETEQEHNSENEESKEGDSSVTTKMITNEAETKGERPETKGEKRKHSSSPVERSQRRRSRSPIVEDEPTLDLEKVLLSWYDSDLHLQVDKETFSSAKPYQDGLFGYAWAGARATHGVSTGKVRYEVKVIEELKWEDVTTQGRERVKPHQRRVTGRKGAKDEKGSKGNSSKDKENSEVKDKDKSGSADGEKKLSSEKENQEKMDVTEEQSESTVEKIEETTGASGDGLEEKDVKDSDEAMDADAQGAEKEQDTVKSEDPIEKSEESSKLEESDKPEECNKPEEGEGIDKAEESDKKEESDKTEGSDKPEEPAKPEEPIITHVFRVGWSVLLSSLQLGEATNSYGYDSTGKFVTNSEFQDYGIAYKVGDVIGAYLDVSDEDVKITFTVNGELQPLATCIPRSELPEENFGLFPHVLSRNYSFEVNFGNKPEPWFSDPAELSDYKFVQSIDDKVPGLPRPETRGDCEVLLMVGLPGSGKTHWVHEYVKTNVDKNITVIGNTHLLDRMTVNGKPLKSTFKGRWSVLLDKLQRCLNKLTDLAPLRRRNYIIDQTNVFPSAQRRKLRPFEGFKRRAVVVVVGDEEQAKRHSSQEAQGGKEVPDSALLEMKANMILPQTGDWLDEVVFSDLNEEEAKAQIVKYNSQGKDAGFGPGIRRQGHRDDRNRWQNRRNDYRGNYRDRGYQRYDRGSRSDGGNWNQRPRGGWNRDPRERGPPGGGGGWRNSRGSGGSGRPVDRNSRDNRVQGGNFNRGRTPGNRGSSNWQGGGGSNWGGWNSSNQNWGGNSQGGWGGQGQWGGQNQWKYGGGGGGGGGSGAAAAGGGGANQGQGYGQQGYSNWNYYGQYPQNWTGQQGQSTAGQGTGNYNNQYQQQQAAWAQYAQQYAQHAAASTPQK